MEYRIRQMTIDDVGDLKLDELWMYDNIRNYLAAGTGPAWILEDRKGPLCAFGAAFLWSGVCEAWFNLMRRESIIRQIKIVKRYLAEQGRLYGVRRYHASVRCGNEAAIKFAAALGFEFEGVLRSYNPDGTDAIMMSLLTT